MPDAAGIEHTQVAKTILWAQLEANRKERERIERKCGLLAHGPLAYTICRKGHPLKEHP